ncbi:LptF/LptG family permease [Roseibacillus ishigakijimensis]|uniref:LptF/LptG family permease n=1 Tax=Roseibacillus ishigakijimensis TaxID=454146 RepID=A0A934VL23_9BACT|nr:LptF/LptG family permease [Roseibacillus ishigakijimensis]MBK1832681.1 LptF/LptG family permease [Roseibacillus ishigakijimensis]
MRISDRYLGRQVFTGTLMGVILLCVILIMGILFQEIRELLVKFQAPPALVAKFLLYSLPYPLMFALPVGFLTTVLLVIGRLSSQNELVGFRTSGVSLVRLTRPIFVLAFFFSLLCWFLSGLASPLAKFHSRELIDETLKNDPLSLLAARSETKLPGFQAFVTEKEGDTLKGFHLYQLSGQERNAKPETYVYATSVDLEIDKKIDSFILSFQDAFIEEIVPVEEGGGSKFITASTAEPWPLAFPAQRIPDKPSYRTNFKLFRQLADSPSQRDFNRISTELQKRHALSFACVAFAFIGIPLGITSRRRETVSGLVTALIVALIYFVLLITAENFEDYPVLCSLMMWLPNFLCLSIGFVLLRKASRL